MDYLPAIVIALVAVLSALTWQIAGSVILLQLTPRSLPPWWRLTIAWFAWLPISGALVLGLVGLHVAGRWALVALSAGVLVVAFCLRAQLRPYWADLCAAYRESSARARPIERWIWRLGGVVFVITLVFAGHPQHIYDQLNYHLVVGNLVVRDGEPFSGALDPHVTFTGVIDYAFAWHRSWTNSLMFAHGAAQAAVMTATVPVLMACAIHLAGASLGLFGFLLLGLPGIFPESAIFRMSKPDGVIATGVVLLLTLLLRSPTGWPFAAAALGTMMLGSKLTFFHAALGLGAVWLAARPRFGPIKEWVPLMALGFLCVVAQLSKNVIQFDNPVYPAAASVFPSWASDEFTRSYWHDVAFGSEPSWTGWLGPILLAPRARSLMGLLAIPAAFLLWRRFRRGISSDTVDLKALVPIGVYLGAYWLSWPLFYGGRVWPRFVGSFFGALFVLFLLLYARVGPVDKRVVLVACACVALVSSQLDRSVPRLLRWSMRSSQAAFVDEWPRIQTAELLNPRLSRNDVVVADRPEKLHFNARLLFEAPLSPPERAMLAELRKNPIEAAGRLLVKAVIVNASRPMSPLMSEIWAGLAPNGGVIEIGPDRVLFSPCYFKKSCDHGG